MNQSNPTLTTIENGAAFHHAHYFFFAKSNDQKSSRAIHWPSKFDRPLNSNAISFNQNVIKRGPEIREHTVASRNDKSYLIGTEKKWRSSKKKRRMNFFFQINEQKRTRTKKYIFFFKFNSSGGWIHEQNRSISMNERGKKANPKWRPKWRPKWKRRARRFF